MGRSKDRTVIHAGRVVADGLALRDRVDIVTGTVGKALGGASGGYVSGRAEIVELLPQGRGHTCSPTPSHRSWWRGR
jgi:7-keto-8-aminopelargonate synthetase-like enzyme